MSVDEGNPVNVLQYYEEGTASNTPPGVVCKEILIQGEIAPEWTGEVDWKEFGFLVDVQLLCFSYEV
jgi:hypothetical protein